MTDLKVYVVEFGDRSTYQLQWIDPNTGKKKTKSSGVKRTGRQKERTAADRAAGEHQRQLREGSFVSGRVTWAAFRERYEKEVGRRLAGNTASKVSSVFNLVEELLAPERLSQVTAERLSFFQSKLRDGFRSEASIKSTMAHLKAAFRWAAKMKMLSRAPDIEMPGKEADKMRGRPITGEEFDRMLEAAGKLAELSNLDNWQRFMRGLWLSGLRVSEALVLSWDDNQTLRIDLTSRRPMLHIPAGCDKSKKSRVLPITPDFAAMLQETPIAERRGLVFKLPKRRREEVGRFVTRCGEKALVRVGQREKPDDEGKLKTLPRYAGCHDLRRSFGERWAAKVMPQVLMELMRHETLTTTLTFYVGKNAERTADAVWAAYEGPKGNTLGNSQPATGDEQKEASSQTVSHQQS